MKNHEAEHVREVLIAEEPIALYKILKIENLATSGGEAKAMIAEGLVTVNGAQETRKRKKIISGDIVEFAGKKMRIIARG